MARGGRSRPEMERRLAPTEAVIQRLHVRDDGELWVLDCHGSVAQPDGIMQTFAVHDADGVYIQAVAVACEGHGQEDRLFWLGADQAVLIRGLSEAQRAMRGVTTESDEESAEELAPLEVICYAVPPTSVAP